MIFFRKWKFKIIGSEHKNTLDIPILSFYNSQGHLDLRLKKKTKQNIVLKMAIWMIIIAQTHLLFERIVNWSEASLVTSFKQLFTQVYLKRKAFVHFHIFTCKVLLRYLKWICRLKSDSLLHRLGTVVLKHRWVSSAVPGSSYHWPGKKWENWGCWSEVVSFFIYLKVFHLKDWLFPKIFWLLSPHFFYF